MNLPTRLELTLHGFTPDPVGLFTYILNHKWQITEDKIREIITEQETPTPSMASRIAAQKRRVAHSLEATMIQQAVNALATLPEKPTREEIAQVLYQVMEELGIAEFLTTEQIFRLGNYIHGNWDELLLIADIPGKEEDDEEIEAKLAEVPRLGKQILSKTHQIQEPTPQADPKFIPKKSAGTLSTKELTVSKAYRRPSGTIHHYDQPTPKPPRKPKYLF